MAIYRGTGGASDSTDDSTISAVTTQAGIATTKANEAASSATNANTSATNAAASATAASGHASTSSDNATASSGSVTDASNYATAASNSATAASNSATAAANSASTANSTEVQAVAAKTTEITGVYNDIANVNTVAGNIADVNTVATNSSNITAVAGDASDIGTVATNITNVNTVGDNIASVNTVAGNNTNINTVAADASDIGTVAGISGNVTTVAGISSDVTTVAGLESKMDTVIADASDIGTVAGNIGDITTVAGISSDVDTVAGISADVTSVADNMTDVQNATTSATNAATSATSASDSASAAATSAGTASSSASDASTSETNAANSATSASNSATAASGSASAASGSESASSGSASAAASSASAASTSASNASNSETNAASSATAASGSASAAAASETNAAASESNANDSKNAAATSATNAATSETNAAASYDSFDDRYLGVKSSAPSTDNDGGALLTGALYFNSTNNTMNVFTGSAWAPVANNNIINPNVALTQDLATNGNDIKFGDNDKATFGASDDLQIYHDGSNSYIRDAGTGELRLNSDNAVRIRKHDNETLALFSADGSATLYHNNSAKIATTATGIDVTGIATMDGLTVDGSGTAVTLQGNNGAGTLNTLQFKDTDTATSTGQDIGRVEFYSADASAAGVQAYIAGQAAGGSGLGRLSFGTGTGGSAVDRLLIDSNGDISFYEDTGTTPKLFWDASAESLGIGTTSPASVLDVRGTRPDLLRLYSIAAGGDAEIEFLTLNSASTVGKLSKITATQVGADTNGSILAFSTSPTSGNTPAERMRIDASGNVGIGGAPAAVTHGPHLDLVGNRGTLTVGTGYFEDNGNTNFIGGVRPLAFGAGGSGERMRIDSSGNVGIGTSSPSANLQVKTGTNENLKIKSGSGSVNISAENDAGSLQAILKLNSGAVTLDPSGNVGIGTSSPSADLHVAGNGRFDNSAGTPVRLHINNSGSNDYASIYADTATAYKNLVLNPSGGNVGIGTTSPAHSIDSVKAGSNIIRVQNSTSSADASFYATNTVGTGIFGINATGQYMYGLGNFPLLFYANSAERMRIDSSGRVGIGTSSPDTLLEVVGADPILTIRDTETSGASSNATLRLAESGASDALNNYWDINHTGGSALRFVSKIGVTTAERMRIDLSGNVGIGTTSPSSLYAGASNLVVGGGSSESGMTIYSSDTTDGNIYFADGTSGSAYYSGFLEYSHGSNYFRVGVNAAERMRIDSSGNLLVGTTDTDPSNNNAGNTTDNGIALRADGSLAIARAFAPVAYLNRTGSDGTIAVFRKDGSTVGSIASDSGSHLIIKGAGNNAALLFNHASSRIEPYSNSATDLGRTHAKFKDLYLSGGVYLGGTGAANKLDDYEEGTWTSLNGTTGTNCSNLSHSDSYYTKVGRLVTLSFKVAGTITSTGVETSIKFNLPFTPTNSTHQGAGGTANFFIGSGAARFGVGLVFNGTTSSTTSHIYIPSNQINASGAIGEMRVFMSYITA